MRVNFVIEQRKVLATILTLIMLMSTFSLLAVASNQKPRPMLSHNFDQRIYDTPTGERTYYQALDGTDGTVIYRTGSTLADPIFYGDGSGSWVTTYVGDPLYLSRVQDDVGGLWPSWVNDEWTTIISQNAANGCLGYTCINVLSAGPDPDIQHGEAAMIPIPSSSVSNDEVTLTWQDFDDPPAPIPSDNPQQYSQVVGYMLYRSTTNATWNNNPAMGPVSGSISDWELIAGSEVSPINSPYMDTLPASGIYYYSVKPVFNGTPDNVSARWGGLGSSPIAYNYITPFVWANNTGGVVRLEWADGTGPFEIFVSNQVDGSGFNFALPSVTTSNFYWEHDALGDGNSYSYIVRGQGSTTNSNIAWKLPYAINSTVSTDINWVSLPYSNQYSTLTDIGYDIGSDKISKIGCWNTTNQEWRTVIWDSLFEVWDGEDDPVKPGMAIFVICKEGQDFTWDIVGSHIDNYGIEINSTATIDQNWISVPYHVTYGKLSDIGEEIGHTVISKVVAWSVLIPQVQNYRSVWYDDLFEVWDGEDDDFMSGMAVMLVCKDGQDFVWTPTVNPIGL